jgi:hypothetical protein
MQCLGKEGDACGGIAGKRCEDGLICDVPATPDAQGVCRPAPGPADGTVRLLLRLCVEYIRKLMVLRAWPTSLRQPTWR